MGIFDYTTQELKEEREANELVNTIKEMWHNKQYSIKDDNAKFIINHRVYTINEDYLAAVYKPLFK